MALNLTHKFANKIKKSISYLQKIYLILETGRTIQFANNPQNLILKKPINIANPECIFLGDNVNFGPRCFLYAIKKYPDKKMKSQDYFMDIQVFEPSIIIGNNVTATTNVIISAVKEIVIEDDVMLASNIFISDHQHGYNTANIPYKYQAISNIKPIKIGKGCWIGQNCTIMPGVKIGNNTIIGANSVVTKNIPEQCIAIGSPAKIIKKWNDIKKSWSLYPYAKY